MDKKFPTARIRAYEFLSPPSLPEPKHHPDPSQRRLCLNESLHPPSPRAIEAIREAAPVSNFYPDNSGAAITDLIAARTGIPNDRIRLGSGSSQLLHTIGNLAIEPGDEAIIPAPTFPMLGESVAMAGGKLVVVPVNADGINDVPAMLAAITEKTRIFYLCTPNNPTGGVIDEDGLKRVIREVPDSCLLVIDEAYAEFAEREGTTDILSLLNQHRGQWIVTRTFSKAYALAALRIGYALCSDTDLIRGLVQISPSFVVSRVAMAAAEAAMRDRDYLTRTLDELICQRRRLTGALQQMGCTALPSGANFLTVRPPQPAAPLAAALKNDGILMQALPWPDENGSLRITVGAADDMDAVIDGLQPLLTDPS